MSNDQCAMTIRTTSGLRKKSNETHLSHVRGRVTGKARKKAKAAGALRIIASGNAENKAAIAAACGIEQLFCGVFSFCVGRA